jgi:hypothetical protein
MKTKYLMVFFLTLLFLINSPNNFPLNVKGDVEPDVLVGVHLGYGDVSEAKALIDRTSSCANFILIGTSRIFNNSPKLTETFQYAYDKGMYFMSFAPSIPFYYDEAPSYRDEWLAYANQTWEDRLVGFYAVDEPGGKTLDGDRHYLGVDNTNPPDQIEAANYFVDYLKERLNRVRKRNLGYWNYPLFTADYGLYWFDYKASYDGLFAEFVGNYSRQLTTSLVRGAARIQSKQWGVLIGWKYSYPPYLASGEELFEDMVYAYDSGAKYILIFDSNQDWTRDILQEEHIVAMEQFWQYAQNNPRKENLVFDRTALVLPDGYGCGFRWPGDKIWGIWNQGLTSQTINLAISNMLDVYGENLDIIFDDDLLPNTTYGYKQLLNWEDPKVLPTPKPTSTPNPTPNPTLTPVPTPTKDPPSFSPFEAFNILAGSTIAIIAIISIVLFLCYRRKNLSNNID